MNNSDQLIIQNQLRNHYKPNFFNYLRRIILLRKCGHLGPDIIVERNVQVLRYTKNISIGKKVILKEGNKLCSTNLEATIKIGNNTTLGYHTMIFSSKSITIGNNCMIAPFCYLIDSNHQIKKDILLNQQPMIAKNIIIKDDVWLGTGVKILLGTKISKGAVVAAGSIVNKDIPAYEIHAGIPAKKIGERE